MISPGTHTLELVSEPRTWESQYGEMKSYTVKVAGDEGAYEISKKTTSPPPTVGQVIDVSEVIPPKAGTNFPPKLKLANKGSFGGGGSRGPSPEDRRAMQRCHSQSVAVEYVKVAHERGTLPDGFKLDDLKPIIDWFDRDVDAVKGGKS